jgi:hypothetical protein
LGELSWARFCADDVWQNVQQPPGRPEEIVEEKEEKHLASKFSIGPQTTNCGSGGTGWF